MTNKSKYTPDNLWVVAENQMVGYCACNASNGALFTYERKEDAQERAEKLIKRLNGHFPGEYDEDSWAGVLLRDCIIGDNQERIIMPFLANQYGEEKTPYTTYTIEEWNKMFPNARRPDTDEEFLHNCRTDIERQIDLGQMYAINEEPRPEHCGKDGIWNDGENFYTILNLYAQYHYDEEKAERLLWDMFEDEYPQYLSND